MKVRIDPDLCLNHTRCQITAPEVFDLDDDGMAFVRNHVVPPDLQSQAKRDAESCPERAITIEASDIDGVRASYDSRSG